jgi:hypothetical protein
MAVLAFASALFISYLWLCGQCENLGNQIKEREAELEALHRRVLTEEYKWEQMKHPRSIQLFLRTHQLEMDWPDERHVLRVPIRPEDPFLEDNPAGGRMQLVRTEPQQRYD